MKKSIYISLLFLLSPILTWGQTNTENYVKSTTYRVPTQMGMADEDAVIESITYYDGLGRPVQSIQARAGSGKENVVQYMEYDEYGQQSKQYLPWATQNQVNPSTQLDYVNPTSLKTDIFDFYDNIKYQNTSNPYSQSNTEILTSRVLEAGAPGDDWIIGPDSELNHTIRHSYQSNVEDDIFIFSVSYNTSNELSPILNFDGHYPANELFLSITKDENWQDGDETDHTVEEYKNKQGQIVVKRTFDNAIEHNTYYIYDDYGNLAFVLSPEASKNILNTAETTLSSNYQAVLDDYGYQYKYDSRNRLVQKKIPGKGLEFIVYDDLDRPILTRDANLQAQGKWLFTKYDDFNRVAYTGIYTPSISKSGSGNGKSSSSVLNEERATTPTSIGDTDVYYTNTAYPSNNLEVLTINYYDSYIDSDGLTVPTIVFGEVTTNDTKGLSTVSRVRVLGTNDWITTILGYDKKARPIYAATNNDYLNTNDVVKTRLDFTGNVMATRTAHTKDSNPAIITLDYFDYDHLGRLLTHMQQIGSQPVQLITQNSYDNLGQLQYKKVGGELFDGGIGYLVNMTHSNDGTFTKTAGGSSNWNAGIATNGKLSGEGGLHFTVRSTGKKMVVGLTSSNDSNQPSDVEYGFQFKFSANNPSYYQLRNPAGNVAGNRNYSLGDRFSIEKINGIYHYIHNEEVVYTHTPFTGIDDLFGDAGFMSEGGAISDFALYSINEQNPLQKVDFKYNVRGWLTEINSINSFSKGASSDLFNFKINYTAVEGSAGDPGKAVSLYNGNIAQTIWRTSSPDGEKRTYGYKYDALNRIRTAYSRKGNNLDVAGNHSVWGINYDRNGNILALTRNGDNGANGPAMWDQLLYNYNGNQLQEVQDVSTSTLKNEGFRDRTSVTGLEYTYDDNGNMISNYNKGIVSIAYNHLNLPESIVIQPVNGHNGGIINYTYDATGIKLKKEFLPNVGSVSVTQYAGNVMYLDGTLQFINHPEGYLQPTSGEYEYVFQYKDHLGNIRLSYSDNNNDGNVNASEIVEESNYYPFGLKQKGYNDNIVGGNDLAQKWKYNDKELNEEIGLNWIDYGWRNYDPALAKWLNIDNLAEVYVSLSPYHFAGNNPIFHTEIDGNKFTPASQKKVDELENYMGTDILNSLREVFTAISEGKSDRKLNKLVNSLNEKIDAYSEIADEIADLNDSDQVYDLKYNSQNDGSGVATKTTASFVTFNFDSGAVEINLSKNADLGQFANELKNAHQFEVGEITFGPTLNYKHPYKAGLGIDKYDELDSFKREYLFSNGGSYHYSTISDLPKEYDGYSSERTSIQNNPLFKRALQSSRNDPEKQKRFLRSTSTSLRHAFRYNGTTYYRGKSNN